MGAADFTEDGLAAPRVDYRDESPDHLVCLCTRVDPANLNKSDVFALLNLTSLVPNEYRWKKRLALDLLHLTPVRFIKADSKLILFIFRDCVERVAKCRSGIHPIYT